MSCNNTSSDKSEAKTDKRVDIFNSKKTSLMKTFPIITQTLERKLNKVFPKCRCQLPQIPNTKKL